MYVHPIWGFHEPISSLTHLSMAAVTLVGTYLLLKKGWGDWLRLGALVVFSGAMTTLFLVSGYYHSLVPGDYREFWHRVDYAMVFLLIAGTFTPIHLICLRGIFWRWGMLAAVWGIAMTVQTLCIFYFQSVTLVAFVSAALCLGWLGLLSNIRIAKTYGFHSVRWKVYGGISYSIGAAFELDGSFVLIPNYVGSHEIFHVFVMLGAFLFWRGIYEFADEETQFDLFPGWLRLKRNHPATF